ncbi:di-heme-cytochrome C peroxidase [Microbulbifer sp. S227A]|uniref:di-heme-cytochrome C peroxidase n=1 Tax=Microbulbifer sp. S227A TaxID=3415131 RepID=UPI003C7C8B2E
MGTLAAGLLAIGLVACDPAMTDEPVYLDQGWSEELRQQFYFTPQGSRMMPNAWFRALETATGDGRFSDPANLARYGLIAAVGEHELNPDGYPVGFAIDPAPGAPGVGPAVGLTCAACHTSSVTVQGRSVRIDGAPAHFDFDSFFQDLARAVQLTLVDEERFERFAGAVLGDTLTPETAARLKSGFAAFQVDFTAEAALRRPALQSGYGRVDALTQIVNSLAVRDQNVTANLFPVEAPTSYPALWLAPHLEFVQWSPIAASPIGRNSGEVLGVFGHANLNAAAGDPYGSTILLDELAAMEAWLTDLAPPAWDPELMGQIDSDKATEGKELFDKNCAGCHNMPPYRRTDPARNFFGKDFIEIGRVNYRAVGTDPAYIESLLFRLVRTNDVTAPGLGDHPVVPAARFFLSTVSRVVGKAMADQGIGQDQQAALHGFRFSKGDDGKPVPYGPGKETLAELKAPTLAGVWATGPYLHNGSVPTVYELLSPVSERRAVFWTGGREIDRERLGFVSDEAAGLFRFDTALRGNGNMGHEYPKDGLTPDQRLAIIEYLKTQ